ncbi:MAG: iron-sulfur cluster assembly protein [Anaerolineales bacterium]
MLDQADELVEKIRERLSTVIDPETGADVLRMRLVEDLVADDKGHVCYTFRPSSPLCPIAVSLVKQIKLAVAEVPDVSMQNITVTGYVASEELTQLINKENE